jgi:hypothetical protein
MKGRSVVVAGMVLVAGCRSKVATLRDALATDDDAALATAVDVPACRDAGCLDPIARALGARAGFSANDPDQASAAAVALVVSRDHRGELVPDADRWITALGMAKGYGADALRLAVAREMARVAPHLATASDDAATAKVLHEMAGALPGACDTYALLEASPAGLPASKAPEKSTCVKRDLGRKEGPGEAYGSGVGRAAAAALALWKDEAHALRAGLSSADPVSRVVLEAKLAVIEPATASASLARR